MNLPKITDLDVSQKKVLLRLDLDCKPDPNSFRLKSSEETLDYLKSKNAEIIIISHRGRPQGKYDEALSLKPFQKYFDRWSAKVEENLRFDPGEMDNNPEFAKRLAALGEIYVNESFAVSHRNAASITSLPKLLPHAAGFRFIQEVENLSKVFLNPTRPLIFVVGGSKKDKVDYIKALKSSADKILVGGRLPEYLGDNTVSIRSLDEDQKMIVANLVMDKEDITIHSIERFEEEIKKAKTLILAGPMGKYEEEGHMQGTERIFKAVADSSAFKVVGGGDSLVLIENFKIKDKFDWVSVGGGAMLELLAKKTLPGIEALCSS
ncbi:phosphoglycerate kinase [Patescibacteria group bacterium]